jgi:hypothetical protein
MAIHFLPGLFDAKAEPQIFQLKVRARFLTVSFGIGEPVSQAFDKIDTGVRDFPHVGPSIFAMPNQPGLPSPSLFSGDLALIQSSESFQLVEIQMDRHFGWQADKDLELIQGGLEPVAGRDQISATEKHPLLVLIDGDPIRRVPSSGANFLLSLLERPDQRKIVLAVDFDLAIRAQDRVIL